jgi:enoyl-CoA hydratase
MGFRAAVRAGTELQALAMLGESSRAHLRAIREQGLTQTLSQRDAAFGDYREGGAPSSESHEGETP